MGREWSWGRSTRRRERDSSGCMSVLLHLFDFHQFPFALQQPSSKINSFLQEDPTILKGVEAPTNSSESEEGRLKGAVPLSSAMKDDDFDIPMEELSSSESSNSPGGVGKTPNLVARLMGLDILPESLSPSSSIHAKPNSRGKHYPQERKQELRSHQPLQSTKFNNNNRNFVENEVMYEMMTGSRSLPDTPRMSSARRSDVDPRLSFQSNKVNMIMITEEFDYSPSTKSRKKEWRLKEENSSPSHYARQIVKQVKESVSRKVGLDITNTTNSRNNPTTEGDALILKSKKPRGLPKIGDESSPSKRAKTLCSARVRFLEPKSKPSSKSAIQDQTSNSPRPISKPRPLLPSQPSSLATEVHAKPKQEPLRQQKCKKAICERFTQRKEGRIRVRVSPAAAKANPNLSDKKCKKTPLSLVIPVKKEPSPSSSQTPMSQVVAQASKWSSPLSSCSYQQQTTPALDNGSSGSGAEFRYVSGILKSTGIDRDTHVYFTRYRWFSPSHPLHPSIFHHLERSFPTEKERDDGQLCHRCNRKLLFHLINEILVDILKPYLNTKPWLASFNSVPFVHNNKEIKGGQLLQQLWSEIRSFPSANCQILQDIDILIEKDLPDAKVRTLPIVEEVESIVVEIERDILDSLVRETLLIYYK